MRNLIVVSTLALSSTLFTATYALPEAYPNPTPAPTAFFRRDSDDDASRVSEALASATSAIAERPSDASSIVSELREDYGTILDQATGCDSSRWARITSAVGNFDENFGDGLRDLFDGIFDGDDDECEDNRDNRDGDDDDNDSLLEEVLDNGGMRSSGVTFFGAMGVALLAGAALL